MKKLLAATALVAMTFSITTPAWAEDEENYDDVTLTPVTLDGEYTAQEICEEALKPNPHSGFQTEPTTIVDTGYVQNPPEDLGVSAGAEILPVGLGTPGPITFNGKYYRNGGSPNVWGGGNATIVYNNGSKQLHDFQVTATRTQTVGCRVWKWTGNPAQPQSLHLHEPPGLQTSGNVATDTKVVDEYSDFVFDPTPYPVLGESVVTLICISPNTTGKKPGSWVQKHGFTGSCSAASAAAGGSIPSGNAPTTDPDTTILP